MLPRSVQCALCMRSATVLAIILPQWFVMLSLPTPLVICDPCASTLARLDPCAALDWTNLPISISPLVASRSKPLVSIGNLSNHVESVCTEVCLKFTPSQLYVSVGNCFQCLLVACSHRVSGHQFSRGARAGQFTVESIPMQGLQREKM